jgi:hypothetical protein
MNGDERLSKLYRDAVAEQPPAEIDARILAAARKPTRSTPAPVTRSWMVPAALAAVLVLAVGLVTFVGRETQMYDEESPLVRSPAPATAPVGEEAGPRAQQERLKSLELKRAPVPAAAQPEPAAGSAAAARQHADDAALVQPEAKTSEAEEGPAAAAAGATEEVRPVFVAPERWLDHIRELKRQGRVVEARRSLEEFRLRYPDTKLPPDLADL